MESPHLERLSAVECRRLLPSAPVGRLAVPTPNFPTFDPVSFAVVEGELVVAVRPGSAGDALPGGSVGGLRGRRPRLRAARGLERRGQGPGGGPRRRRGGAGQAAPEPLARRAGRPAAARPVGADHRPAGGVRIAGDPRFVVVLSVLALVRPRRSSRRRPPQSRLRRGPRSPADRRPARRPAGRDRGRRAVGVPPQLRPRRRRHRVPHQGGDEAERHHPVAGDVPGRPHRRLGPGLVRDVRRSGPGSPRRRPRRLPGPDRGPGARHLARRRPQPTSCASPPTPCGARVGRPSRPPPPSPPAGVAPVPFRSPPPHDPGEPPVSGAPRSRQAEPERPATVRRSCGGGPRSGCRPRSSGWTRRSEGRDAPSSSRQASSRLPRVPTVTSACTPRISRNSRSRPVIGVGAGLGPDGQEGEAVVVDPAERVGVPGGVGQHGGDLEQRLRLLLRVEAGDAALDVDHHQRRRAAVAGPAPLLHAEHLEEAATVGETGDLVDHGGQVVVNSGASRTV